MIKYLTGASTVGAEAVAFKRGLGLMVQPGNSYHLKVQKYPMWAGDNGAFTKSKGGFSAEKFRTMLSQPILLAAHEGRLVEYLDDKFGELCLHAAPTVSAAKAFAATHETARVCHSPCLFIVAPDKLQVLPDGKVVGDAAGTLKQFPAWAREIRAVGFPVALVAQNGLETMLDKVPWDLVDVLFLGGGPESKFITQANRKGEWKLTDAARVCAAEAKHRGKMVHMGRVNSEHRLSRAAEMLIDTADGTFLKFGPKANLPRLLSWLESVNLGVQAHLPWRNA